MEHNCNKESEITIIWESIHRLTEAIYGNGKPGMKEDLAVIKTETEHINREVSGLSKGVRAMMTALDETKGARENEKEHRLDSRQKTKIWITGLIGFFSIAVTILVKFIK